MPSSSLRGWLGSQPARLRARRAALRAGLGRAARALLRRRRQGPAWMALLVVLLPVLLLAAWVAYTLYQLARAAYRTFAIPLAYAAPRLRRRYAAWRARRVEPRNGQPPYAVLICLPEAYLGGIWETTKKLVRALAEINRRQKQLRLTLVVHPNQSDLESLQDLGSALCITKGKVQERWPQEVPAAPAGDGWTEAFTARAREVGYCELLADGADRHDAWFFLLDRFFGPLVPGREYGVIVYDMIQLYVREIFDPSFYTYYQAAGMPATIRRARFIMTTSEATRREVTRTYGLARERVTVIPVACEPDKRFGSLSPEPIGALGERRCVLNVANASRHKGARELLRGYACLKRRLGEQAPPLVICGAHTERFVPDASEREGDLPYHLEVRQLVRELGLCAGRDVLFLGFVTDAQLLWLFQRAAAVVNAARHDNGSYSLIEGHYFGRPVLSCRYPAAEELCRRFDIPARFFPLDDEAALAGQLAGALAEPPATGQALAELRQALAAPRYGYRRYAEQVYEQFVRLGQSGRLRRLGKETPLEEVQATARAA